MPTTQALIGVFENLASQDVIQVINSSGQLIAVLNSAGGSGTVPTSQSLMGRFQNPSNQDLIQTIDQSGNITAALNSIGGSGTPPTLQAVLGRFSNPQSLDLIQTVNEGGLVSSVLPASGPQIISFAVTDSTVVATWTSPTAVVGSFSANGIAAVDNDVQLASTSHQQIVAGLPANTGVTCIVQSGSSLFIQTVKTAVAHSSIPVISVAFGSPTATVPDGDIPYNFLSNNNITYMIRDDAQVTGTGANQQLCSITNEATLAIAQINPLTAYGGYATTNGTDGPGGIALSNKANGLFGMKGSLFMFTGRHEIVGTVRRQFYGNVIRSDNHGVSWSNFNNPTTFNANGIPAFPNSGSNSVAPFFFGNNSNWGWVTPVRYAGDDGTYGYTTSGNGFDGGNAYVYFTIIEGPNDASDYIYMGRIPRVKLFSLTYSASQFWIGPTNPTSADFVNNANWQSSTTGLTKIYSNTGKVGWQDICFIPAINRYLLFSTYRPVIASTSNTVWLVMEGPTPAGPWTQVGSLTNNPSGYYNQTILHRTASSNTLTQSIPLTVIYSGDFQNQVPYYHPTYSSLTLTT
jgi:hypothetical protein